MISLLFLFAYKLTKELGRNYSVTTLKYIRRFYEFSKSHSVSDQLTYTHYKMLFGITNNEEINYYIETSVIQNLSVRELRQKIKFKEYERLPEETKLKLKTKEDVKINET